MAIGDGEQHTGFRPAKPCSNSSTHFPSAWGIHLLHTTEQNVLHLTAEKSITAPHLAPEAPGIVQFPELSLGLLGSQGFQTGFKDLNFRLELHQLHLKPGHLPFASHVVTESCSKSLFQTDI